MGAGHAEGAVHAALCTLLSGSRGVLGSWFGVRCHELLLFSDSYSELKSAMHLTE